MMRNKLDLCIFSVFLVFIGCINPPNEKKSNLESDCKSTYSTIKLTEVGSKKLGLTDIAEEFEIIRLAPDAMENLLIGDLTKCWQTPEGVYIVADMKISNKIYLFDKAGNHVRSIENHGNGPAQFTSIWDVQFDPSMGNIQLWDYIQRKLLTFDKKGDFVEEQKINKEIMTFLQIPDGDLIVHLDRREYMGKKTPFLYRVENTTGEEKPLGVWDYGIIDSQMDKLEFSRLKEEVYFHRAMTDTIFSIHTKTSQICPVYVLDFEGNSLNEDTKKQTDLMKFAQKAMEASSAFSTGNLVVTDKTLHLTWSSESESTDYYHYSSKSENKSLNIVAKNHSIYGIPVVKIIGQTQNEFIGYSFPYRANKSEVMEAIENPSTPEDIKKSLIALIEIKDQETPFMIKFKVKF
jgi:hypothetical protein